MAVVLATNDDGISAPGLKALVRRLINEGFEVYVVAPKKPMSNTGKSLTWKAMYGKVDLGLGEVGAWWIDSTPAAALIAAVDYLLPKSPDVVISGINRGPNIGLEDLLTSGTVGAALEAALRGYLSIASSLATEAGFKEEEYYEAAKLTALLAKVLVGRRPESFTMVNVNVPSGGYKGILVTRLAINAYKVVFRDENGILEPVNMGMRDRYWDLREGTDVWAVMRGYVSVTPITIVPLKGVMVSDEAVEELESLIKNISHSYSSSSSSSS